MATYYNTMTGAKETERALIARGMPIAPDVLAAAHIYPVESIYPGYDKDVQYILPKGKPTPKDGDASVYVQAFEVVSLSDADLSTKLTEFAESQRRAALEAADESVSAYMALFSDVERATWPVQQSEVNAYLADQTAPTPTLDGLAQARGISREAMLEKAIAKIKAFEPLSVAIVGRQQSYEDDIATIAADETKDLAARVVAVRDLTFDYSDILSTAAGA